MTRVRRLPQFPSFDDCLIFAQCFCESFRADPVTEYLHPPHLRFVRLSAFVGGIRDPRERLDQIIARAKAWKAYVLHTAWGFYESLVAPGTRAWVAFNDDDVPVGCALWTVPKQHRPVGGFSARLYRFLRHLRSVVNQFRLRTISGYRPIQSRFGVFSLVREKVHFTHTEERAAEIAAMTPEEREHSAYTNEISYDLHLFGVSEQRRGHGFQLFKKTFDELQLEAKPVKIGSCKLPPKFSIMATGEGKKLYSKFGFETVAEATEPLDDVGKPFNLSLMTRSVL